tara:strand:+ start:335 stop:583 length:249 start_codon:yes stop_codon:yes gene_type:complete
MQIQANKGSIVLDYYPIKDWNNTPIPDKYLRILTFRGETMTKRIVSSSQMDEDVISRTEDYGYKVTQYNTIPQYSLLHKRGN